MRNKLKISKLFISKLNNLLLILIARVVFPVAVARVLVAEFRLKPVCMDVPLNQSLSVVHKPGLGLIPLELK